jgi:uncharacterized membrane protein
VPKLVQAIFVLNELIWFSVFALVLGFSVKKQGFKHSSVFFLPAILWGLLLEYATQEIFQRYRYGGGFLVYIANVPLNISLAWASLMFITYWLFTHKIKLKNSITVAVTASLPLLVLDFFILEPTAEIYGLWTWTPQSIWFGSPLGNVYGWFWVIVLYLSFYQFIVQKINNWEKALALNLGIITLRVLILIALLQVWKVTLGGL